MNLPTHSRFLFVLLPLSVLACNSNPPPTSDTKQNGADVAAPDVKEGQPAEEVEPPQATGPAAAPANEARNEKPKSVGGYAALESSDQKVQEAAKLVLEELQKKPGYKGAKLAAITKAEGQVVAGYNYRLVLSIQNGEANEELHAVVFRPLSGPMSVSKIGGEK